MNEQLPYEELIAEKLGDIQLPNEEMAWQDMKRRLDEEEKRRFLPFWLNGCMGWVLIGLLATGLAWWIFKPLQWFENGNDQKIIAVSTGDTLKTDPPSGNTDHSINKAPVETIDSVIPGSEIDTVSRTSGEQKKSRDPEQVSDPKNDVEPAVKKDKVKNRTKDQIYSRDKSRKNPGPDKKKNTGETNDPQPNRKNNNDSSLNENIDTLVPQVVMEKNNRDSTTLAVAEPIQTDTLAIKKSDSSIVNIEMKDASIVRKPADSSRKKAFTFSAGVGVYQQLPVGGQSFVPYNSLGRKSTIMDYLPSIILRLNREEKWFIQSEYRYGAPQYNKELLYRQGTDTNQVTQKVTINSTKLLKTYYHQLPLTFNYYILPGLSIGGGVTWNRFSSAISERSEVVRDLGTGLDTALVAPQVFRVQKNDSAFEKSFWQAVFEASLKRKKFSAGFRYSFGLQPFIRFSLPGGVEQSEKNSSLQFFIRYELWRSKKKAAGR